jgi:hypothetical protein
MKKAFEFSTRKSSELDYMEAHILARHTKREDPVSEQRNFKFTTEASQDCFQSQSYHFFIKAKCGSSKGDHHQEVPYSRRSMNMPAKFSLNNFCQFLP